MLDGDTTEVPWLDFLIRRTLNDIYFRELERTNKHVKCEIQTRNHFALYDIF